jgi:hypothetical protein
MRMLNFWFNDELRVLQQYYHFNEVKINMFNKNVIIINTIIVWTT